MCFAAKNSTNRKKGGRHEERKRGTYRQSNIVTKNHSIFSLRILLTFQYLIFLQLTRANADLSQRVASPPTSHEGSNAEAQLDQLISVVNKRVDEWKDLMATQNEPVQYDDRNPSIPDQSFIEQDLRRALVIRNQEINALRRSLSEAVFEIEESAKMIDMLKYVVSNIQNNSVVHSN